MEQRSLALQSSSVFGPWLGSLDDTSIPPCPQGVCPLAAIPEAYTKIFFCFATIHFEELGPHSFPQACHQPSAHPVSLLHPTQSRQEYYNEGGW